MPTLTISISDGMKKRLEKHSKKLKPSVSGVCQLALDRAMSTIEKQEGNHKMTMTERMQVQSQSKREEIKHEAHIEGMEWAQEHGDFDDLQELKENCASWNFQDNFMRDFDEYNERKNSPFFGEWIEGFCEGALEAFDGSFSNRKE